MFTKYMFNTLNYNPAYAGSTEYLSIVAIWREQWLGWNGSATGSKGGAPRTQTISAHQPFQERVGLGLSISHDAIGPTASTSVNGNYAYKIPFSQGTLSLGINAGVTYWRADWDKLSYKDPRYLDPVFANGNPTIWIPIVGAGTYYFTDRFYAGFSVPRLFNYDLRPTDQDEQLGIEINAQTYRHFYFTSGGAIDLRGSDIVFKPSVLIKSVGLFGAFASNRNSNRRVATPTEFDIDLSALFYNKLWLGFSFRSAFE